LKLFWHIFVYSPRMQQYVIIGGRWYTLYQKKKKNKGLAQKMPVISPLNGVNTCLERVNSTK